MPGGSVRRKIPQLGGLLVSCTDGEVWKCFFLGGVGSRGLTNVLWIFARRANNRYTLWHHDLIPTMRMQVAAAHKTRLRRMRVDPAQDHQILTVAVVEQRALVHRFACVGSTFLVGDHELGDEQRVPDECAAEYAARFEVGLGVGAS